MLQQYKHILVPVDGSKEAELAFKKSVNVALRNGDDTELRLLHVVDTRAFQNVSSFDSSMVEQVTKTAKITLNQYIEYAKKRGVKDVSYTIEYGAPKRIIAREIPEKMHSDLIMIGATGLNAIERIFVGSVTEYVTWTAICDVLVVRTDLDNEAISK